MSERKIGKVISVDSFRLIVQLDQDLKSLYKSGFNDIYEIARINSYLIIPVGADRIVAIISRVKVIDETEIEKTTGFITLPKAQRYLVATMIGTIENDKSYLQGVYNYPILDNPVWYVVKDDLDKIFDTSFKEKIDYNNDYFLPIGTSPAFVDYKIQINPDKFFGKHVAVLGNTGSGKSCTVASVIQSLFKYDFKTEQGTTKLKNAHFIIFDTNGEYKRAFSDDGNLKYPENTVVNALHINIENKGITVPYWFMNYDDMEFLFKPSDGSQAPIFKRAISLAKGSNTGVEKDVVPDIIVSKIYQLQQLLERNDKEMKIFLLNDLEDLLANTANHSIQSIKDVNKILNDVNTAKKAGNLREDFGIKGTVDTAVVQKAFDDISEKLKEYWTQKEIQKIKNDNDIDLPIYFDFSKIINLYLDQVIASTEGSKAKLSEYISTFKLRLQSFFNDERISLPLMLKSEKSFDDALAIFVAFVIGDLHKIYDSADPKNVYSAYYEKSITDKSKTNQISIIDMSLLPFEVLETITGLVGRLILEFVSRFRPKDRGSLPIVIVLEEAQNYIPEKDRGERVSIAKRVFERIAREGRKYGISLIVSSQRPSELSKTVLSQCNTFIIHRLQNPEDQKYVRQLVSAANEDILQQLPILPQQHAIVMGDGVRTPVQMKVNTAKPTPNSENPKFVENWLKEIDKSFPDYKTIAKAWEAGKGIDEFAETKAPLENSIEEVPKAKSNPKEQ